jgi:hypothetical protein
LHKLRQRVTGKKKENAKIEEEIMQLQLALKERKRIYSIHMKSSEGASEARKGRLRQVMMISRLKRVKVVQETNIEELQEELTAQEVRLRILPGWRGSRCNGQL